MTPLPLSFPATEKVAVSLEDGADGIVKSATVDCFITDGQGLFVTVSPTFALLLGYSRAEICQKHHSDMVYAEDWQIYRLLCDRIISQELEHCHVSLRYRQKTGTLVRLLLHISAEREQLVHRFQEIDLQLQIESVLRHTVGLGLSLFENTPLPMWIYDLDTLKFLAVNNSAVRHYGYNHEEFLSMRITDIRPPEDVPKLLEAIAVMPKGYCSDGVWRHLTRSGDIIYVETSAHSINFGDRKAEIVLAHNVTEQKLTEIALRQAEIKYRSIFENAVEGIFQTTAEGKYITANPMLAKIYGYASPDELMAGLTDIANQLYVKPERRQDFKRILQEQDAVWHFESQVYRKDGSVIWISENARAVRDTDGELLYFEGTVEDITEQKRSAEELNLLQTMTIEISSAEDFHDALSITLKRICEATGWQVGEAWLPDSTNSFLEPAPVGYISSLDFSPFHKNSQKLVFTKGLGLLGRVWQTREPEWVQDISLLTPEQFIRRNCALHVGLRSAFAVPIMANCIGGGETDREVLAVVNFFMQRSRPEDTRLINLVSAIAVQLSALMQRKRTEAALRESEESFRLTFEHAPIGIAMTSLEGQFLQVNQIFSDITGYGRDRLLTLSWAELTHPEDLGADTEHLSKLLLGELPRFQQEKRLIKSDRSVVDVMYYASVIRNPQGEPLYIIGQIEDITERKRAKAQIEHMAFHDPLTDLPNRVLFINRLNQALQFAREQQSPLAVLFLDLDRFKLVNDTLGHDMGDRLLQSVVKRLKANIRHSDTLARMGGDEFMLLMPNITNLNTAEHLAQRILRSFESAFALDHHEVHIGVSIGISLFPSDGGDAETLMKHADAAMFRAKELGRNHYQLFTSSLGAQTQERASLEYGIRRALQQSEFLLHYQPQYDLASGKIIGVEALVRWQHPDLGMIYPSQFIHYAEECGLICQLGEWILHTACTQALPWQDLRISVNCSVRQFHNTNFAEMVRRILQETGLAPHRLELEITESAMMKDEIYTVEALQQLQEIGVHISIDDFGTGYSSLSHLKQFPVEKIKIDASFVRGIPDDSGDTAITQAIVAMAHSLKLQAIAEGVETTAQLEFLRQLGCDAIQGFLFSHPISAQQVTELLAKSPFLSAANFGD